MGMDGEAGSSSFNYGSGFPVQRDDIPRPKGQRYIFCVGGKTTELLSLSNREECLIVDAAGNVGGGFMLIKTECRFDR